METEPIRWREKKKWSSILGIGNINATGTYPVPDTSAHRLCLKTDGATEFEPLGVWWNNFIIFMQETAIIRKIKFCRSKKEKKK
jgi:hypothetical protein